MLHGPLNVKIETYVYDYYDDYDNNNNNNNAR